MIVDIISLNKSYNDIKFVFWTVKPEKILNITIYNILIKSDGKSYFWIKYHDSLVLCDTLTSHSLNM